MRNQSAKTKGKGKGRKGNAPVKMHRKLRKCQVTLSSGAPLLDVLFG